MFKPVETGYESKNHFLFGLSEHILPFPRSDCRRRQVLQRPKLYGESKTFDYDYGCAVCQPVTLKFRQPLLSVVVWRVYIA
jgi:hypothetical protein